MRIDWSNTTLALALVILGFGLLRVAYIHYKPEPVVVPELESVATIHSCEFLDYTQWKSGYVKNVYWSLMNDKYPVRSEFIRDFSATDSDLIPLAECLWEWYINVWRWNGTK